jgi:ubiquinone/menaquinone biosynthesis C-methylase UbiE
MSFDADMVRAFEHAGWQKAAAHYQSTFAAATREFAEALLDAATVGPGAAVLDLCCGTGQLADRAAARGAMARGLDFSPAMLAAARSAHPGLRFTEGDAEAIPFPDAAFDAVVSSFGVHHVPRPDKALAEAFRVLRPGGRVAFSAWAAPADNIAWRVLFDAIRLHVTRTPRQARRRAVVWAARRLCCDC